MRIQRVPLFVVLHVLATFFTARATAKERAIYVSPSGNDAWNGTIPDANQQRSNGPVASLSRARDLARAALKADRSAEAGAVHVYVRGGDYLLAEPLVLSPADSGTEAAPVVWSAYASE